MCWPVTSWLGKIFWIILIWFCCIKKLIWFSSHSPTISIWQRGTKKSRLTDYLCRSFYRCRRGEEARKSSLFSGSWQRAINDVTTVAKIKYNILLHVHARRIYVFRRKYIASGFAYDRNIFCCYFVFMSAPFNIMRTKRLYDQYYIRVRCKNIKIVQLISAGVKMSCKIQVMCK